MRVAVLASGSRGNCTLIESAGARVLIDAGLAPKRIAWRLQAVPRGPRLDEIDAVLLTHDHSDHASGAPALAAMGLRLYATAPVRQRLGLDGVRLLRLGPPLAIGDLTVRAVAVPHDAPGTVAFTVEADGVRAGIVTDCGHVPDELRDAVGGLDVLVLEANHDPRLLAAGPYPPSLKRRIASRLGHLSNDQTAELLRRLGRGAPRALVLAHLSQINNRPQLARRACTEALGRRRVAVAVSPQGAIAPVVSCTRAAGLALDAVPRGRQLSLFAEEAAAEA